MADETLKPEPCYEVLKNRYRIRSSNDGIKLTVIHVERMYFKLSYRYNCCIPGELLPGEDCKTDEQIDSFIRAYGDSAYHPSCTCKMGVDDMSVTDNQGMACGLSFLHNIIFFGIADII